MRRRTFIQSLSFAAIIPSFTSIGSLLQDPDEAICLAKFEFAKAKGLAKKPILEVMVELGNTFLGTEYAAHTIEEPGEEHLVINLRTLDCVLFYENTFAISRCIKKGKMTFDDFKKEIQFIRYRDGIINGYPSRLHYTSDAFFNDEKKGLVRNITKQLGGVPYKKKINFMTTHIDSYRQLKDNPEFVKIIAAQEEEISKREMYYIPKEKLTEVEKNVPAGCIVGITTNIEGMDIAHTGITVHVDNRLHFMHAPNVGHKVMITEKSFADYLAGIKKQTGIMLVQPLEL